MSRTLHLIGNAHLDPVWLWEWDEGLDAVRATFRAQLDLLNEDPNYVFTCSSSCYYQWIEQTDPAMFDEIRAAVAAGRIVPVGGWFIQAEANTGNGESFARLGLYGQKYFISRFNFRCQGGYLPDTFGHHGNLPALLLGAELNYHIFNRPPNWGLLMPQALFQWTGANGQSVPTYRIAGYCFGGFAAGDEGAATNLQKHMDRSLEVTTDQMPDAMFFYGVGNHGGGPTRHVLKELAQHGEPHARSNGFEPKFSHPDAYFASAADLPMPEHRGSIQKVSIGCYAGWNRLKRAIRHAEYHLFEAEALTAAVHALNDDCRQPGLPATFEPLWHQVLFVIDHDISTGCAIQPAEADALKRMAHVEAQTDQLSTFAAASLARLADAQPPAAASAFSASQYIQPLVVIRPQPGPAELPVEIELIGLPHGFTVFDQRGAELTTQQLPPRALAFNEGHGRRRFLIHTSGHQPNLSTLFVAPRSADNLAPDQSTDVGPAAGTLQSAGLALQWDRSNGIESVTHNAQDLLEPGAPWAFNLLDDDTDSWGHTPRGLYELILNYEFFTSQFTHRQTTQTEHGPIRQSLRSTYEADEGIIALTTSLIEGFPGLLLDADIHWHGRFKMLKFSANTLLKPPHHARGKIPYCHESVETDGRELPLQEWIHLEGDSGRGIALITDSTYSYSVRGPILDATLLRSIPYAWDYSTELQDRDQLELTDHGRHQFRFLIVPGPLDIPRLERLARELLLPPRIVRDYHHAPTPAADPLDTWITAAPDNVAVTAVKRTEADDGVAVRLVELTGQPTRATLNWRHSHTAHLDMDPVSIHTIVFRDDGRTESTSFLEGM